jgi:hypothetical protein
LAKVQLTSPHFRTELRDRCGFLADDDLCDLLGHGIEPNQQQFVRRDLGV